MAHPFLPAPAMLRCGSINCSAAATGSRRPLVGQPRPRLVVEYADDSDQVFGDLAALWWYPTERWRVGELVRLAVPGLPLRRLAGWRAEVQNVPTAVPLPRSELAAGPAN